MGWICQRLQTAGAAWHVDDGHNPGALCSGASGWEHPWYLVGASQNGADHYIDAGRPGAGSVRAEKMGRSAVLMCFVPAALNCWGCFFLAPKLLGITWLEAAVMGAVLAAVSPAVVVPRMVKLMEEGYGGERRHPQLILASASVDDVYVIVLFSTFVGMMQGEGASLIRFVNIRFLFSWDRHRAVHWRSAGSFFPEVSYERYLQRF